MEKNKRNDEDLDQVVGGIDLMNTVQYVADQGKKVLTVLHDTARDLGNSDKKQ